MNLIKFTDRINYKALYALFDHLTPLPMDCGQVCGGACCRDLFQGQEGAPSGMRLFPGEEAFRRECGFSGGSLVEAEPDRLYICSGVCRREERPLACRLFPLFPALHADGRIRAVYDPRAWRVCPLVRLQRHVPLDRRFVRAVRAAGREIARTGEGRAFLARQAQEIQEFNRFLRLDRQRPPICRRAALAADGTGRHPARTGKENL